MKTIEERAKEAGIISQYKSDYRYDKRSVVSVAGQCMSQYRIYVTDNIESTN